MSDLAVLGMRFETPGAEQANRQLHAVAANSGRAEKASDALTASMRRQQAMMGLLAKAMALISVAALAASFRALTTASLEYSASLREVSTLVDTATVSMDELSAAAVRQAGQFNSSALTQSQALYQIISAGATTAAQATDLLTASNMLAVGGVTSVTIAADGLTSVLNAYGDQVDGATAVSDAMFVAMRAGKTDIAQLSASLGTVAPLAAQAGVAFDELVAATAALTKGGMPTTVAMNGLRAIIAAIVKPAEEAKKLAKDLGIEFNAAGLASMGLAGFIEHLKDKTGGSTEAMAMLFGGVEALSPVLALVGKANQTFAETLDQMTGKAGETQDAFDKIASGPGFQLGVIFSTLAANAIGFGAAMADRLVPALTAVAGLITGTHPPSVLLEFTLKALAVTAGVAVTVALYKMAAAMVTSSVAAVTGTAAFRAYMLSVALVGPASATATVATTALGVAIRFALGPIGLAITAIGLLAAAWTYLAGESNNAEKEMRETAAAAGAGGQMYLQLRAEAEQAAAAQDRVAGGAHGAASGMAAASVEADDLKRRMTALGIETEYAANKLALLGLAQKRARLASVLAAEADGSLTGRRAPGAGRSPLAQRLIDAAVTDLNAESATAVATAARLRAALARVPTSAAGGDNGAASRAAAAASRGAAGTGGSDGSSGRSASQRPELPREVMDRVENVNLTPLTAIVRMVEPLRVVADEMRLIDQLARESASGMADAFGETGRALGGLLTAMSGYQSRMAEINLAEREFRLSGTQAARERSAAEIASYGDMASAAKGFFKEGSDGYRVLQAAEQAYRAVQFAMSIQSMIMGGQETAFTVGQSVIRAAAFGVEAVANALRSLPFPLNLAAGAATIAALAAIGVKLSGGGSGGSSRQASVETAQGQTTAAQAGNRAFANAVAAPGREQVEVRVTADRDGLNAYVVRTSREQAVNVAAPLAVATASATKRDTLNTLQSQNAGNRRIAV